MPLQYINKDGSCYVRYGNKGKEYTYQCNNEASKEAAKKKALAQAVAIGEFAEQSFNDYPDSVKNNAKRGIELNDKNDNKCATQVGKVRAQQLANGEKISIETIKRMYSYLSRAEVYYDNGNINDCGYISYLLWGGKSAKAWAESKINQFEKEQQLSIDEVFANEKISFDYDETLTRSMIQDVAKEYIDNGADVYVISARHNVQPIYTISDELGIPRSRVYATGSNKAKLEKILELGIDKHYDNNENIIKQLGNKGELVQLSIHQRFAAVIKFISNDNTRT